MLWSHVELRYGGIRQKLFRPTIQLTKMVMMAALFFGGGDV